MENSFLEKYELLPQTAQQTVADLVDFLFEKYKKERLEAIVRNLGFESLTEFVQKREQFLGNIWQNLDFESEMNFVQNQVAIFLKEQMALSEKEIAFFEQKYRLTLSEMKAQFEQITQFDILEKEMDEMQWEGEDRFLTGYQKLLTQVENGIF